MVIILAVLPCAAADPMIPKLGILIGAHPNPGAPGISIVPTLGSKEYMYIYIHIYIYTYV